MPDEMTTTEAAAYLAEQGYTVKSRRESGVSGPPTADTLKHWCIREKLKGARKRENRWFIPKSVLDELLKEEEKTPRKTPGEQVKHGVNVGLGD